MKRKFSAFLLVITILISGVGGFFKTSNAETVSPTLTTQDIQILNGGSDPWYSQSTTGGGITVDGGSDPWY